ncbi:MAG: O-antigen ligase family protein [Gammaproteobacteria bacterium]|nr:O-antigen ligase family protein [Gammaproteobacteria bacterium]
MRSREAARRNDFVAVLMHLFFLRCRPQGIGQTSREAYEVQLIHSFYLGTAGRASGDLEKRWRAGVQRHGEGTGLVRKLAELRPRPPLLAPQQILARSEHPRWFSGLVWLTMAVSSIVLFEPAPYDLLVLSSLGAMFLMGLRVPREIHVAVFLLALFVVGNFAASAASGNPAMTARPLFIRTYMVLSWLLFACVLTASPGAMFRVLWQGYTIAALLAVVWGNLGYFGLLPDALRGPNLYRASGPFKDANVYAPFLVPVALYTAARIMNSRGPQLGYEIVKMIILVSGLLLAFSRGAWLNFLFAFTIFMLLQFASARALGDKVRLVLVAAILALTAASVVTFMVTSTTAGQQFAARTTLFQEYDTARGGRFDTQGQALRDIGAKPLGVGPGMSASWLGLQPHNLYLHVTIEGGWIAGIGFVLFLILSLTRGLSRITGQWKHRIDLQVVFAALSGTLLQSFFIDSTHWRHLWLLLAMLWALTVAFDRERAAPSTRHSV